MVASWRVMIVRSPGLIRLRNGMRELFGGVLVGDVEDDQPALLELVGDDLLALGLDLAASPWRP